MARGDHSLKRSAAAASESKPFNKKAKTGHPADPKPANGKPKSEGSKPDFKKAKPGNKALPATGKHNAGKVLA
jgi:hypothetical protein